MAQEKQSAAAWPGEMKAEVARLWQDGLSAKQIAEKIGGGKSRNAVIGVLHRMGVSQRGAASSPRQAKPKAPAKPRERIYKAAIRPAAVIAGQPRPLREPAEARVEAPGSATVLTLGAHMCKWPIGDPSSDSFTLCGRRQERGSYCSDHAASAYRSDAASSERFARALRRYA